jgi:hypothetical protein
VNQFKDDQVIKNEYFNDKEFKDNEMDFDKLPNSNNNINLNNNANINNNNLNQNLGNDSQNK